MAEISLLIAVLFRPDGPKLQLFETTINDVVRVHDFVLGQPPINSKGVQVTVLA
jgi:hypothetical protein